MRHLNHHFNMLALVIALLFAACLLPALASAQTVTVDITAGHQTNTFSPVRALGAGVDAQNNGAVAHMHVLPSIKML